VRLHMFRAWGAEFSGPHQDRNSSSSHSTDDELSTIYDTDQTRPSATKSAPRLPTKSKQSGVGETYPIGSSPLRPAAQEEGVQKRPLEPTMHIRNLQRTTRRLPPNTGKVYRLHALRAVIPRHMHRRPQPGILRVRRLLLDLRRRGDDKRLTGSDCNVRS